MSKPWEVFDPKHGHPIYTTRWEVVARILSWWHGLDYEREGVGWPLTE